MPPPWNTEGHHCCKFRLLRELNLLRFMIERYARSSFLRKLFTLVIKRINFIKIRKFFHFFTSSAIFFAQLSSPNVAEFSLCGRIRSKFFGEDSFWGSKFETRRRIFLLPTWPLSRLWRYWWRPANAEVLGLIPDIHFFSEVITVFTFILI